MSPTRREVLTGLGGIAATAAAGQLLGQAGPVRAGAEPANAPSGFPRKADFSLVEGYTYISGAFTHPMPRVAAEAMQQWGARRAMVGGPPAPPRTDPRPLFAALINARPTEISYVPNTSTGENWVVEALGIRKFDGNVVTDGLHFEGALIHLMELRKAGLDLRVVMPREGRIDLADMERVIDRRTRLVESRSSPCTTASSTTSRRCATWLTPTARMSTPTSSRGWARSRST